jgi:hypothetical protein
MRWRRPDRVDPPKKGHEITADELVNDAHAAAIARMALIERMDEQQVVDVIHGLEAVATRNGDRTGSSGPARAALILRISLEAKRRRASRENPDRAAG